VVSIPQKLCRIDEENAALRAFLKRWCRIRDTIILRSRSLPERNGFPLLPSMRVEEGSNSHVIDIAKRKSANRLGLTQTGAWRSIEIA
jgi:hypothetical protein